MRPDKAPKTVERFVAKARSGFYDGLTFHRVEDWVVQGGDPKGTGTGGERVPSEYNDLAFKIGAFGIARGPDAAFNNDSQFFVAGAVGVLERLLAEMLEHFDDGQAEITNSGSQRLRRCLQFRVLHGDRRRRPAGRRSL